MWLDISRDMQQQVDLHCVICYHIFYLSVKEVRGCAERRVTDICRRDDGPSSIGLSPFAGSASQMQAQRISSLSKGSRDSKTKTTSKIPIQIIGIICRFRVSNFSQPAVLPFLQTP